MMNLDRLTPVELALQKKRRIKSIILILLVLVIGYYFLVVKTYTTHYTDNLEHFKYGSIGSEPQSGLPYWIFKALPHLFKDKLGPTGYAKFGLIYENKEADLPIGFSQRTVTGINRVWLNCSVCHTGTYIDPKGKKQLIVGAPANDLRLLDFIQFFREAAADNRLTADNVLNSIEAVGGNFNFIERLIYRYIVVDQVRDGLLGLQKQLAFLDRSDHIDWGPGRVDTFNPYKAIQFNFPMDKQHLPAEQLNGSADYPSIWMQRPRAGMNLHWDGNNSSVAERNLSAALGAGVTPVTVDRDSLKRLENWLMELPPPAYPKLGEVNQNMAEQGAKLYQSYCSECHGQKPLTPADSNSTEYEYSMQRYSKLGRVETLANIGTDRGRYSSYTKNFSAAQNMLYAGYPWRFSHFKKTSGYANHPLDAIWARSPYLHNGSVPTLRDLLEPSDKRPSKFYRGSKNYNWQEVGYQSYSSEATSGTAIPEPDLYLFRTDEQGNSNKGHEGKRYGTYLTASQKDAIVEYMKTL